MSKNLDHQALLERLVSFDTTSSKSNRACIDFIRDYLDSFKIKSEILVSPDGAKACLFATLGGGTKAGIMLAGHSDTVPVEDQQWTSDPFKLTARDDKLYARGSCDMKGFIACALEAAAAFADKRLKRPVHLAFTYDEELNMDGAIQLSDYLAAQKIIPQWVWIGEPTGLRIVDSHKGITSFATSITGVAGHGSLPDQGLNAIELAADYISAVQGVADAKKKKPWPNSRFEPAYTTFNIGTIRGGTAENIIAEHCEISWQAREHPGDSMEFTLADVDKLAAEKIKPRLNAFPHRAHMTSCICMRIPPLLPTANNPGEAALVRLTGHNRPETVPFATEAGFFQKLGAHAVICGPGHIEQAHQADEYVEKSQLKACAALLDKMLAETAA